MTYWNIHGVKEPEVRQTIFQVSLWSSKKTGLILRILWSAEYSYQEQGAIRHPAGLVHDLMENTRKGKERA